MPVPIGLVDDCGDALNLDGDRMAAPLVGLMAVIARCWFTCIWYRDTAEAGEPTL